MARALAPLTAALTALEARLTVAETAGQTAAGALGTHGERLAGLEARAPVAGPPGAAGRDGLGFDDLAVTFDGDRMLALTSARGGLVKTFPVELPIPRYRDIYQAGATYRRGDLVMWAGLIWHCAAEATTAKPGDATIGTPAWRLMVKRPRDGRDGRDAGPEAR